MRRHEHRWMRYVFRQLMLAAVLGTGGAAAGQGQVVGWGLNQDGQARPISTGLFPLKRLAAGHENVIAIYEDGSIRCWGNNEFGQTSIPPDILPVVEVAIGDRHVVVRQSNGAVRAWGRNADGQCNVPSDLDAAVSIAAGSRHSLALGRQGGIRAWGANGFGQAAVPQGVGSALAIAAGYRHSIAIRVDGSVVCWGDNADGQCSVPAGLPAAVSAAGGAAHTLVLLASGEVRGWGQNQYGQINVPAGLGPVEKVVAGELHSVVKLTDGAVRCWGFSGNGQISPPADLGPIRDVVAAWRFTAAITSAGTYRFWGWPDWLAIPPMDRSDIMEVDGGSLHTLARLSDGSIRAWGGATYYGQTAVPTDLGPSIQIAAGEYHSVALLANGTVRCWGYGHSGATTVPTDLGPVTRVAAGYRHTMAIRSDGTVRCWGSNSHGQRDVPQDLGTAIDISGGAYHSIALRSDGTVRVWGDSQEGQQNVPAGLQEVVSVRAGVHHGVALRSDGTVRCWGSNWVGECNVPAGLAGVVQIAAGSRHSIALRSDGTVVCWGAGTTIGASPHFGQSIVPANLGRVTAIGRGHFNSFAILSPEASSCANSGGAGTATVSVGGGSWQNVNNWSWSDGGGPQVPGALTDVDLGEYGSIGSLCSAQAGTFTARSGSTLIVPFDGSDAEPEDHSIQVLSTANLAGRILLMASGVSTLPADLDIPVLSTPDPRGSFDIIQTNVPPPPGKFLALIPAPSLKGVGTVFRLQLRDIRRDTLVDPDDGIGVLGTVVAVEPIDLDADGFDDLALAVDNGPSLNGSVHVLLNDGSGRMGSIAVVETVPPSPTSLSVGDADGDGLDDVAVGVAGDSTARLFLNDGEGGLSASTVFSIDGIPLSVNVMPAEGPSVTGGAGRVLVGVSGGVMPGFGERVMFFPSTGGNAEQVVMLAASGPGAPQAVTPIVLVRRGRIVSTGGTVTANVDGVKGQGLQGGPESGGMVAILEPDAAGNYAVTRFVPIPGVPVLMDMGDVDGDGHPEIVSANRDPVFEGGGVPLPVLTMIRGGADGFGDAIPIAPTGASAGLDVTLVDPDDDGDLDIVSVHRTVGRDSEARLILVDVEEPGGPVSIGEQEALVMDQPQFSVRGEFDAGGGEDFLLVEEAAPPSLVEGTGPTRTFLGILPPCPGDVDGSGEVGPLDLGAVLSAWMTAEARCDFNQDGLVDGLDIAVVLARWGACP